MDRYIRLGERLFSLIIQSKKPAYRQGTVLVMIAQEFQLRQAMHLKPPHTKMDGISLDVMQNHEYHHTFKKLGKPHVRRSVRGM